LDAFQLNCFSQIKKAPAFFFREGPSNETKQTTSAAATTTTTTKTLTTT